MSKIHKYYFFFFFKWGATPMSTLNVLIIIFFFFFSFIKIIIDEKIKFLACSFYFPPLSSLSNPHLNLPWMPFMQMLYHASFIKKASLANSAPNSFQYYTLLTRIRI